MRVTTTIQNRNFLEDVNRLKTQLNKSQHEVSSGKTVSRLSDNPFAASQDSEIMSVIATNDQFESTNSLLRGKFELTDVVLQSLNQSIDAAKVIAAQALSGTTTPDSRTALATAVDGAKQEVLTASNTQFHGNFLFSGTETTTEPFIDSGGGTITYQGNDEALYQRLDRSVVIESNVTGQDLFIGTTSIFTTLDGLKTAIQANDTVAIRARMDDLEAISSRINTAASVVGNNMRLVDQLQDRIKAQTLALQEQSSNLTDANLVKSISDLNLTSQAIDVTLNAQAKVQQLSLLDFLR